MQGAKISIAKQNHSTLDKMQFDRNNSITQLIISIFALYVRTGGNWLAVSSIVSLVEELGVANQAVRSSVSRLKKRGVLLSKKRNGVAGYALSSRALEIIDDGDERIFKRPRATKEDGWVIVAFSVPEQERSKRHTLRVELSKLGFGAVANGFWIAPGTIELETRHMLLRVQLAEYIQMFKADYLFPAETIKQVQKWWDLDELSESYQNFIRKYEEMRETSVLETLTPKEAFCEYIPMLTDWRRLPYRDPGIALEYLPADWKGEEAATLFANLNAVLRPKTDEYFKSFHLE